MDNFSSDVPALLEKSRREAIRHSSPTIDPSHLLLAMLSDMDSDAFKLVERVTQSRSAYELYQWLDNWLFTQAAYSPQLAVNELTNRIVKLSVLEARILKHPEVTPVHLLLAIFHNPEVLNMDYIKPFTQAGVDYRSLYNLANGASPKAAADFLDEEEDDDRPASSSGSSSSSSSASSESRRKSSKPGNDTPMLDKFGHDMTRAAAEGRLDPVVGRETEIERLAQILSRRKKNNPVLIGEPGVGKSAIVEGLALRITQRKVSRILFNKRVISLDMAGLVAGTKYRGEFEERIKAILNELTKNPDIILFIDEIHTIVGAGNPQGQMDAANLLKPALARGELQCIGATTLDEYRKNIEKDGALERRFQKVMVDPTTPEETLAILNNIKDKYEQHHNVTYSPEALEACVKLTERYVSDRNFPDKAIDALDEAG
ncbi:MAG: ATP-dependent Clp protease ATP-binding subunit, partial [Muribaculaceae bacterium]|nr:ATP-dependent Clp protease ATP-binding subunit [Muribaculaceae bacterium]